MNIQKSEKKQVEILTVTEAIDRMLDYVYYLKGDSYGGIAENEDMLTVPLYLADRITFDLGKES